jgi:hypothetical protein
LYQEKSGNPAEHTKSQLLAICTVMVLGRTKLCAKIFFAMRFLCFLFSMPGFEVWEGLTRLAHLKKKSGGQTF